MKTITALEIQNGDTIITLSGHILKDVIVERDAHDDGLIDIYGRHIALALGDSQCVILLKRNGE